MIKTLNQYFPGIFEETDFHIIGIRFQIHASKPAPSTAISGVIWGIPYSN
jgi:hypothetical protein